MSQKVIIVGAGLIGACIALNLQRGGAQVTLIEAGLPGSAASGRSFGWINAGFYLDETHHHLRVQGIEAWHRLHGHMPDLPVRWSGCLCWDLAGDALEAQIADLTRLRYPIERLDRAGIATRAPQVSSDVRDALWFPTEGAAEAGLACHAILRAAQSFGAKVMTGTPVVRLTETAGRIDGVMTSVGGIAADAVIVAAGNGAPDLLRPFDVALPMLTRPGAIVRTLPMAPLLEAIMVSPDLEFRQDGQGRLLAPCAASHQSDDSEVLDDTPDALATDTLHRLQHWLPAATLEWDDITLAMRPVPGDGRPVVGPCGPEGLHVAVMHSGVTLGALMGELVAGEVLTGAMAQELGPYRPQRFV